MLVSCMYVLLLCPLQVALLDAEDASPPSEVLLQASGQASSIPSHTVEQDGSWVRRSWAGSVDISMMVRVDPSRASWYAFVVQ